MRIIFIFLLSILPFISWAGVDFNGDADWIDLGDSADYDPDNAFSTSIWVYSDANQSGRALSMMDDPTYSWIGAYLTGDSGRFIGFARVGGTAYSVQGADNGDGFYNGAWHHVVTTFDRALGSNRVKLYIDGVHEASNNAADGDVNTSTGGLELGRWGTATNYFNGKLNEFYFWKGVALTQAEIDQLYASKGKRIGLQIQPSSLKVYLPLDDHPEGTALNTTVFKDISGNGHDGTGTDVDGDSSTVAENLLTYP